MKPAKSNIIYVIIPLICFFLSSFAIIGSSFYLILSKEGQLIRKTIVKQYTAFSSSPPVFGTATQKSQSEDARASVISAYFQSQNAPLADYGTFFVAIADKYGLDWTLLPAIAMQESNGGKKVPEDSHNPFGWAIYTNSDRKFESWEESIEAVAKGIKEDYVSRGLVTTEQIMRRYNPTSYNHDGSWAKGVSYFIDIFKNY